MMITFFEKPLWCIKKGSAMTDDCQVDIYGNDFYLINLLPFSNKLIFFYSCLILTYFNLKFYAFYALMKGSVSDQFWNSDRRIRLFALTVINILHFLLNFLVKDQVLPIDGPALVKTIAIITIIDWLYFTFKQLIKYLVNFYELMIFFMIDWLLVSAFLEVIFIAFPKYYDHQEYFSFNFSSFEKSLFSVAVFFTRNNSPEIILKNFVQNRFMAPIFISVIFINNMIIMALLIGLSYYKMKITMVNEISSVNSNPRKKIAFNLLQEHPDVSSHFIRRVFAILAQNKDPKYIEIDDIFREEETTYFIKTRASEHIFGILKKLKSYEFIYSTIDVIIVLFAMYVIHTKAFDRYHYFLFSILLCMITVLDFLHHCFFHDIWNFNKTWKTVIDIIITVTIIVLAFSIIVNKGKSIYLIKIWALMCVLKSFRFFVLYFKFDRMNMKSNVLFPVFRYIYNISSQLCLLLIIFSSIGYNVYGGNINSHTIGIYNQALGVEFDTGFINLNTFINSFIFFSVVIFNQDWHVLVNLSVVSSPQHRTFLKLTFVFFKIYVNYVLLNSLIAFIMEIMQSYRKRKIVDTDASHMKADDLKGLLENSFTKNLDRPIQ